MEEFQPKFKVGDKIFWVEGPQGPKPNFKVICEITSNSDEHYMYRYITHPLEAACGKMSLGLNCRVLESFAKPFIESNKIWKELNES
jgi:hypothetical protein